MSQRIRLLLLIVSIAGNATAAFLWLARDSISAAPISDRPAATQSSASNDTTESATAVVEPAPAPPPSALWSNLDHSDLTSLIRSLRAAGYPTTVIRAIAEARAAADLADLKQRIGFPLETEAYWLKPESPTKDQAAAVAELKDRSARLIDDLLHDQEVNQPATQELLAEKHGPYSAEKLTTLERIERDYADLRRTHTEGPAQSPEAAHATRELLEKEREADIAAALGPDDYLDYRLRHSPIASGLRFSMAPLGLSEAEFRTIFLAAESSITLPEHNYMPAIFLLNMSSQNQPDVIASRAALLDSLRSTLSPTRFAEVEAMFNPETFSERTLLTRLNLPITQAPRVHDLRTQLRQLISTDRSTLSPEQLTTLSSQQTAIETDLKNLLGPAGYDGLLETFNLRPVPAAAATVSPTTGP